MMMRKMSGMDLNRREAPHGLGRGLGWDQRQFIDMGGEGAHKMSFLAGIVAMFEVVERIEGRRGSERLV